MSAEDMWFYGGVIFFLFIIAVLIWRQTKSEKELLDEFMDEYFLGRVRRESKGGFVRGEDEPE